MRRARSARCIGVLLLVILSGISWYPDAAKRRDIYDRVHLGYVVPSQGIPTRYRVIRSAHLLLSAAAVRAVAQTRFEPGTVNGQPVPVWLTLPVTFNIR